jgi:pimeloyl-ACP methyl ester carboxylesterase
VIGAQGYADLVASLLAEFNAPPVVLGHSFGGRVAVCLAASRPDEVGPLVLSGVPLLRREAPVRPALAFRLVRALNRWGLVSDERLEAQKRRRGSADYRAASGVMRDILVKVVNEGYEAELSRLQSEVLLIWGERDSEVPVEAAIAARDLMERAGIRARLEVMMEAGHHIPLQRPNDLRAAVEEFLT